MKVCPWCAEQLQDAAVKCPNCQSWLRDDKANSNVMLFVDEGLIRFGKFAGALLGIFLVGGAVLYGFDAHNASNQAHEARSAAQIAQNEAQKSQNAAQKSAFEMQQWVAEQQKTLGSRTTLVDQQIKDIDQAIAAIRQRLGQISGRTDNPDSNGDSLFNLARTAQGLQANLDTLAKRLNTIELSVQEASRFEAKVPVETLDTLTRTLRVRQVSSPVEVEESTDARKTYYDLTFSLCVQNGDRCEEQGLDAVEKVIYRLDQRWFSKADETRISPANQFSFTTRVWGITEVTACIYLKAQTQKPVVRAGRMSLRTQPQFWGPEYSVVPAACPTT